MLMAHEHYYPCHRASYIIPRTISTPWGVCSPCCQMCSATSLIKHNYNLYPHRSPFILLGEEKHHGRGKDSNPHSDDLAIRTQVWCTKPLWHGTPYVHTTVLLSPTSMLSICFVHVWNKYIMALFEFSGVYMQPWLCIIANKPILLKWNITELEAEWNINANTCNVKFLEELFDNTFLSLKWLCSMALS